MQKVYTFSFCRLNEVAAVKEKVRTKQQHQRGKKLYFTKATKVSD